MKTVKKILTYCSLILLWAAFLFIGTGPPAPFSYFIKSGVDGQVPSDYIDFVKKKAEEKKIGNLAVILIEDGSKVDEFYSSISDPVNGNTFFNVASISKWVTTWAILNLVEEGKLELDAPVNTYLTRWQLNSGDFDTELVTVRNLLTHTAGLNREFEFFNNTNIDAVPTIEGALSDAKLVQEPGSGYSYSNVGFGVLQLVIEEVTGQSFNGYLKNEVFRPLGMHKSTFIYRDSPNKLAPFYNTDNTESPHFLYSGLAAHSLYTTPDEFSKFMVSHLRSNPVLDDKYIHLMSTPFYRAPYNVRGLGVQFYDVSNEKPSIIGHNGLNRWAINSSALIDLEEKDGILVFCNGSMDFAAHMSETWLYWKKGIVSPSVQFANLNKMLVYLGIGIVLIIGIGIFKNRGKKAVGGHKPPAQADNS